MQVFSNQEDAMLTASRIIRATLVCAVLTAAITGTVLWTQGYRVYVVHTGSMDPTYQPGDVVVDRPADRGYHPGEIITFRHSSATTDVVTHRITDITKAGLIHTKGDANRTADVWDIRPDQVKGSVAMHISGLGYLLVFMHQPSGAASIALAALAVLLLWKVFFPTESDSANKADGAEGSDSADSADDADEAAAEADVVDAEQDSDALIHFV
jgi:signal peptidase I